MNYKLNTSKDLKLQKASVFSAVRKMLPLLADEKGALITSLIAIIINAGLNLTGPIILGYTIDHYVQTKQYHGVLLFSGLLFLVYATAFVFNYIQMKTMGGVGQRTLFKLRNLVFTKLQELPLAFFNQNKAGDLISRINNDTDKLNQLFSQTLMQFTGNIFIIIGAGIFVLVISLKLGLAALLPALGLLVFTQLISSWIKHTNYVSLTAEGAMSGEIQESINNFKVILAFNRRDYFREKFKLANYENFITSVRAGIANNLLAPIYDFASNIAQLIVLMYGIYLILQGQLAVGLLISFILYINRFYDPLRQMASLWSSAQTALAGWERINQIVKLDSDVIVIKNTDTLQKHDIIDFKNVHFRYDDGKEVLRNINFSLEKGKTYALVGPTGGGKSTTASLIARLYDPSGGQIFLDGKDIRSYDLETRTKKIGFILQEPFLFTGTVRDNLLYGNEQYMKMSNEELENIIKKANLAKLLERFNEGLETKVQTNGDTMSLGQRQLIAFMRAILREPELLILDEATANIDTVTEQLLEEILAQLPKETTKVIIAHRLNTIENADDIFFVNGGEIIQAGSMEHAMEMLMHGKRQS